MGLSINEYRLFPEMCNFMMGKLSGLGASLKVSDRSRAISDP
jgi:hypothetical protein